MTNDELLQLLERRFERLLLSADTVAQAELMWLMIRVSLVDFPMSKSNDDQFGGGVLLCEMCVRQAPFPSLCFGSGVKILAFTRSMPKGSSGEPITRYTRSLPIRTSGAAITRDREQELFGFLIMTMSVIEDYNRDGEFNTDAYRSAGLWANYSQDAHAAMRYLRRTLDHRSNVLLTSLLAHRVELICRCPFGLRPRY